MVYKEKCTAMLHGLQVSSWTVMELRYDDIVRNAFCGRLHLPGGNLPYPTPLDTICIHSTKGLHDSPFLNSQKGWDFGGLRICDRLILTHY